MSEHETRPCPYCAETIKREARVCRFCRIDLSTGRPLAAPQAPPPQKAPAAPAPPNQVRASSGVGDGLKLGCGMFIVLPLIIFIGLVVIAVLAGMMNERGY